MADLPVMGPVTVVVTHLHADHFNGLTHLAQVGLQLAKGTLTLVMARLPRHPEMVAFVTRFYALELVLGEVSGIPDLDFANALIALSPTGFDRLPRSRGEQFKAAGQTFDVLWPPRYLGPGVSKKVFAAVEAFDALAAKDPGIAASLERVRQEESIMNTLKSDDSDSGALSGDEADANEPSSDEVDTEISEGEDGGAYLHAGPRPGHVHSYDPRLNAEVRDAARAFREAANYMSLVFATPGRHLMSWGDAPQSVVKRIAKEESLGGARSELGSWPRLHVALAPHHGSQGLTPRLRDGTTICVSSHGPRLHQKWLVHHPGCPADACVSTYVQGDFDPALGRWC
jgi:hypothetical protein